jgi:hypothetical protein
VHDVPALEPVAPLLERALAYAGSGRHILPCWPPGRGRPSACPARRNGPVPVPAVLGVPDAATEGTAAVADGSGAAGGPADTVPRAVARHGFPADPAPACACGCGRPVPVPRSGPPRRYATAVCRAAVYRRRRAEVPLDLPRQPNDHGRRRLAATQRT